MSSRQTVTIICPQCGQAGQFTVWSGVNVTLKPDLKSSLLDHSLNRVCCPQCQATFRVVPNLVYHDMAAQIMITVGPDPVSDVEPIDRSSTDGRPTDGGSTDGGPGTDATRKGVDEWARGAVGDGYRLRRVATMNDLVEKILIFDAHKDDRVIEIIKCVLSRSSPDAELFFNQCEQESESEPQLVFERHGPEGFERLTLPMEVYDDLAGKMEVLPQPEPDQHGHWPTVDNRFAQQFLN
jgi:hypothetical protein